MMEFKKTCNKTSANLETLDFHDYQHAISHMKPEVKVLSASLARKLMQVILDEFGIVKNEDGMSGDSAEASFMAALGVALSVKGASFPEDMPQELREEVEAYVRDKKYPN